VLKADRLTPDTIFGELRKFCGGFNALPPRQEGAVYAVLAYFFERCDIFEEPPADEVLVLK